MTKQSDHNTKAKSVPAAVEKAPTPKEIGGRNGPDPVRYGDWEVNGKATDF